MTSAYFLFTLLLVGKNQEGFGHYALILIMFVILLIGLSGWYVYHRQQSQPKVYQTPQTACGTLKITGRNGSQYFLANSDYGRLKNCFVIAYESSKKTSIGFHSMGVDDTLDYSFSYSGSFIKEQEHYSGISGGGNSTDKCQQITEQASGLLFKCDGGDLLFSSEDMPQVPNNF